MVLGNSSTSSGAGSEREHTCPHCGASLSSGVPARRRRWVPRTVAKVIVLLLAGTLAGYGMTYDDRENTDRAESLTFEQYASEFEQYKEDLVADVMSPAVNLIGALFALATMFGLYEAAGAGLGWLINRVLLRDTAESDLSVRSERA